MPGLNTAQKNMVTQFVSFTQVDKKTAEKHLKNHNWNVQQAVDGFFSGGGATASASNPANTSALSKMFDKYRDDVKERPDNIGMEGSMSYFQDLSLDLEDISVLIISELLACPSLGEIERQGFVNGWSQHNATTTQTQKSALAQLRSQISKPDSADGSGSSNAIFRRVYKHTWKLGCPEGSRAVPLESALVFWKQLFGPQGMEWKGSSGTAWVDLWEEFLNEKWKKSVNRDMWDQLLLFKEKTMADESMGFWSEEASWPGVIDDFVLFVKARNPQ